MQEENPKWEQRAPQSWVRAAPHPHLLFGCILRSNFSNTQSEKEAKEGGTEGAGGRECEDGRQLQLSWWLALS